MAVNTHLRNMDSLLGKERDVLRSGNFRSLSQIAEQKADLLEKLVSDLRPADREILDAIKARASGNQRFLAAALAGVKAARTRIAAVMTARESLSSYDRQGNALAIAYPSSEVERRA